MVSYSYNIDIDIYSLHARDPPPYQNDVLGAGEISPWIKALIPKIWDKNSIPQIYRKVDGESGCYKVVF